MWVLDHMPWQRLDMPKLPCLPMQMGHRPAYLIFQQKAVNRIDRISIPPWLRLLDFHSECIQPMEVIRLAGEMLRGVTATIAGLAAARETWAAILDTLCV